MAVNLRGAVACVTGGGRGIGAATARALAQAGAQVVIGDLDIEHATAVAADIGPTALAVQLDVADPESFGAFIARANAIGPISVLVNNAGITKDNLFPNISVDDWYAVIDTNLNGVFNTLRPIVPKLYERGNGSLVFISSVVGEAGNIGQANYAASKSAVIGLAKTLGLEGSRYGVRANVVAPGFTSTDMVKSIPEKVQERILSKIPMRRFAEPEEIAWATAFLLSPVMAGYITGEILSVNGGQYT